MIRTETGDDRFRQAGLGVLWTTERGRCGPSGKSGTPAGSFSLRGVTGHRLAIIGGGNMGAALGRGLLDSAWAPAGEIAVVEVLDDRRRALADLLPGVTVVDAAPRCEGAVLAVKPGDVPGAAAAASAAGATRILSIAAGVGIDTIQAACGPAVAVIRAMPNTAALVGAGAAAVSAGRAASADDVQWATTILGAVGTAEVVPEHQLDAVTGLSGSGPAYLFLVAEALIDAGVSAGLTRAVADALVRQLLRGAAALLADGTHPAVLRNAVTSPGGTTAAGLAVLERQGVRAALIDAVAAATARSAELGRPAGG